MLTILPPPTPLDFQVRAPLGVAAELLRAGYVCAAAEVALALIPPFSSASSRGSTPQEALTAGQAVDGEVYDIFLVLGGDDAPVLRFLIVGLLRALATALAGAAVSSVGGGGVAASVPSLLTPTVDHRRRGGSLVALPAREKRFVEGAEGGVAGWEGRGRGQVVVAVASCWFVPSGALGGVFYALTTGGVFCGLSREYVFGESMVMMVLSVFSNSVN